MYQNVFDVLKINIYININVDILKIFLRIHEYISEFFFFGGYLISKTTLKIIN